MTPWTDEELEPLTPEQVCRAEAFWAGLEQRRAAHRAELARMEADVIATKRAIHEREMESNAGYYSYLEE